MRFIRHTNGRIRALEDFELYDGRIIEKGTLGGTIASVRNLAQSGMCWVFPGACLLDDAYVSGNAVIQSGSVAQNARVYGNAVVDGGIIMGNACVAASKCESLRILYCRFLSLWLFFLTSSPQWIILQKSSGKRVHFVRSCSCNQPAIYLNTQWTL